MHRYTLKHSLLVEFFNRPYGHIVFARGSYNVSRVFIVKKITNMKIMTSKINYSKG